MIENNLKNDLTDKSSLMKFCREKLDVNGLWTSPTSFERLVIEVELVED